MKTFNTFFLLFPPTNTPGSVWLHLPACEKKQTNFQVLCSSIKSELHRHCLLHVVSCGSNRATISVSNLWGHDAVRYSILLIGFKSASFAYACQEGILLEEKWEWKWAEKHPERERERKRARERGIKETKRRNEWTNKWITDGMWVSASRKLSLSGYHGNERCKLALLPT